MDLKSTAKPSDCSHSQLMKAIEYDDLQDVRHLLSICGDDVNKTVDKGQTALIAAVVKGNAEAVGIILESMKLDVNKTEGSRGWTPLYRAVYGGNIEIVQLFLKHPKLDVNKADSGGQTPLYCAVYFGNIELVRLLLKHPTADVNKADSGGETPLYR
eukprot:121330_1